MKKGSVFAACAKGWVMAVAVLLAGCDESPVGPMSPPDVTEITAPDSEGYVTIRGVVEPLYEEEQLLVFNDNIGEGVMERLSGQGEFEVQIRADVGDVVVVQAKAGYSLSVELLNEVPAL